MSVATLGELTDYTDAPRTGRKRGMQLVAASLIAFTLIFGAAKPADAVIVPYTKGSDFWYSWFYQNGRAYTAGNVRYSWSWMWYINGHKDTIQGFTAVACGVLPNSGAKTACAALVVAFFAYIKGQLALALKYGQCLQFRFALPPLGALTSYGIWRVKCVR